MVETETQESSCMFWNVGIIPPGAFFVDLNSPYSETHAWLIEISPLCLLTGLQRSQELIKAGLHWTINLRQKMMIYDTLFFALVVLQKKNVCAVEICCSVSFSVNSVQIWLRVKFPWIYRGDDYEKNYVSTQKLNVQVSCDCLKVWARSSKFKVLDFKVLNFEDFISHVLLLSLSVSVGNTPID